MPVSNRMKSALRSTMGGKGRDGAPFNAASQGGYRNMAKQIAGGAKMSARGMANAQQGQSLGMSRTSDASGDATRQAANAALQRMTGGPAATDAMGARGMGGGIDMSMARQFGGGYGGPAMGPPPPNAPMSGRDPSSINIPTAGMSTDGARFGPDAMAADNAARAAARAAADAAERESDVYVPAPSSPSQTTESMVEQTIRDLLMGGVRDTTAEENLAREMIQAQQQQALVDQRARAGRAGLVQTGAQAGIESDIRQKAAQQALAEIYGIQAGARGEQRADVGLAGQLYGMDKQLAAEEARNAAILEALKQMYGTGDAGDEGPAGIEGAAQDAGAAYGEMAPSDAGEWARALLTGVYPWMDNAAQAFVKGMKG